MTRKRWLVGAGAGSLLLVGGLAAGPIASLAQGDPTADLSKDEAAQIAIAAYPGTTANGVDLEEEDGRAVYEVNLSNGYEVEVDGNSGKILETEASDDGHEGDDADENDADDNDSNGAENEVRVPNGTIDDGAELLPQAKITLEQAITAAQGAAQGDIGEIDLEYAGDRLVFNVDVGDKDVKVDATDGSIVSADSDD
jgi:uncharacterized membrane protein YkoI